MSIIDSDDNPLIDGGNKGWTRRDFEREPFGSLPFCGAFDLPLIHRSEWRDRINVLKKAKATITDLCDAAGLKMKNQESTNYCWINAPTRCAEILRVVQGEPYVELSPASIGAKIKGFRNVGGWGTEGLRYGVEHGWVPTRLWPNNAIDRRYDTAEANQQRANFRVAEWWDLEPGNFDVLATVVLLGFPVAIGLSWWGHEVTAVELVDLGGNKFGMRIDNSWGTQWGENGRSVLSESKATPDDAVAPRSVIAS